MPSTSATPVRGARPDIAKLPRTYKRGAPSQWAPTSEELPHMAGAQVEGRVGAQAESWVSGGAKAS